MNYKEISKISESVGEAFYVLDTDKFVDNWNNLLTSFRDIYKETYIAYSYKTNYIPRLCKLVDEMGGYAEIVSHMEYEITKRLKIKADKVIFNGPYKNKDSVKEILLSGGIVNIDSISELPFIIELAKLNSSKTLNIGIRCNFKINDNVISRFGIDVLSDEFKFLIDELTCNTNICIKSLHCHFACRSIETWKPRAEGMLDILQKYPELNPENIDLGGGLYGNMKESLKEQFDSFIPKYSDYANEVANVFKERFSNYNIKPKLFIEPGSALVGDVMQFISKVVSIKNVRGKKIATLLGSIYNINPTLNKKNPPITVLNNLESEQLYYEDLDFSGFTCIESDYLYKGYSGFLSSNDFVLFDNVGSYSVVLKPPFILPNFPIIEIVNDKIVCIKEQETFDNIFSTYKFDF
ncbi:pyridoxal-dependent decarboxylase [Marinilabiliaceae bacterium JC040]|nr:pyridoxal-dependent decarboxylase [Marinilabiliaceae bacterium JC040]